MEKDFAFTGGRPDPFTFPTEGLIEASEKALRKLGAGSCELSRRAGISRFT